MSDPIRKRFSANLDVNEGERAVTAMITTDSVDRDGDVMSPKGADLKDFAKSPTVFFNHNYNLPIGKTVALKRTDHGIEAKTVFAKRPETHEGEWLPDTIFSLFQQGVIKGFSIGFQPVKGHPATDEDKIKFGNGVQYVFDGWKLLEYSVAPLPANQDALATAVSKGIISESEAKSVRELLVEDDAEVEAVIDEDTKSVTDDDVELVIEDATDDEAKSQADPMEGVQPGYRKYFEVKDGELIDKWTHDAVTVERANEIGKSIAERKSGRAATTETNEPAPEPIKTPRLNARRIVQRMMQLNSLK